MTRGIQTLLHQTVETCGSNLSAQHEFLSLGEQVCVAFSSDAQNAGRGFKLEYNVFLGCNRTYEGEHGRILSPRYPYRMRGATNCSFSVSVPQGRTVSLYFATFGLQGSTNCSRGSLKVIILMQLQVGPSARGLDYVGNSLRMTLV